MSTLWPIFKSKKSHLWKKNEKNGSFCAFFFPKNLHCGALAGTKVGGNSDDRVLDGLARERLHLLARSPQHHAQCCLHRQRTDAEKFGNLGLDRKSKKKKSENSIMGRTPLSQPPKSFFFRCEGKWKKKKKILTNNLQFSLRKCVISGGVLAYH